MRGLTRRVAIATIFGALIFVTKAFVPSPVNKMIVVFQALLLALGSLLLEKMGATYVALIGGFLTALWNFALAPFTLIFALLFGMLIDGSFLLLRVSTVEGRVNPSRLVVALTLSTALVGASSYYTTVHLMDLIPRNPVMEMVILIVGTISGAVAGYITSLVWNRHLRNAQF
ncbi:MAG: hypothetical protein JSV57_05175 [Candidatus Bathyarchaeota archaeon]|nr:MAG: hypothetical protein JSV57_05175 [Candidatus Bathyarchaeota archaeon]